MHFSSFPPLYIRYAVKVGIACLAAYGLSFLIGSHYAVWAVVSTIIAMQVNVAESLQVGINRIIGTVVGAASGVLLLVSLPKDPYSIGAGVLGITCVYAYLARYGARWSSASIAAVIVLLSGAALVDVSIWAKLFSVETIRAHQIHFAPELKVSEDMEFSTRMLCHSRRVSIIRKPLYHYRAGHESSIMNNIVRGRMKTSDFINSINAIYRLYRCVPSGLERGECRERITGTLRRGPFPEKTSTDKSSGSLNTKIKPLSKPQPPSLT